MEPEGGERIERRPGCSRSQHVRVLCDAVFVIASSSAHYLENGDTMDAKRVRSGIGAAPRALKSDEKCEGPPQGIKIMRCEVDNFFQKGDPFIGASLLVTNLQAIRR